jgi:hypothetical protein
MSASCDLARLIARYRFLQGALDSASLGRTQCGVAASAALSEVFLQIVRFEAEDPAISCRQIEFLLGFLAEGHPDPELRRLISKEALAHVRRLADKAGPGTRAVPAKTAAAPAE